MSLVLPHDVQRLGCNMSLLTWMGKLVYLPNNPHLYRVTGVTGDYLFLKPANPHDKTVIKRSPMDVIEYRREEEAKSEGHTDG